MIGAYRVERCLIGSGLCVSERVGEEKSTCRGDGVKRAVLGGWCGLGTGLLAAASTLNSTSFNATFPSRSGTHWVSFGDQDDGRIL